ncbi:hypothetical protein [Leisingera aquaemixtae]|uniref:Uncharacterized protein n=1 Tax=Leisingera aquaemixtae TaxID=1396826 RepID=A0A0P1HDN2_9RHOB|nr:hypothetical protein [Leisingera aquaemixtae]CUI01657.1 hypothetical protein PHA8399_03803 [Leisingera aquaemixtae]
MQDLQARLRPHEAQILDRFRQRKTPAVQDAVTTLCLLGAQDLAGAVQAALQAGRDTRPELPDPSAALEAFQAAAAQRQLGMTHLLVKCLAEADPGLAEEAVNRLIESAPQAQGIMPVLRGLICEREGRFCEARAWFEKAGRLACSQADTIRSWHRVLEADQRWGAAHNFLCSLQDDGSLRRAPPAVIFEFLANLYLAGRFAEHCLSPLHQVLDGTRFEEAALAARLETALRSGQEEAAADALSRLRSGRLQLSDRFKRLADWCLLFSGREQIHGSFAALPFEHIPVLDAVHIKGSSGVCMIFFDSMGQENSLEVFQDFAELALQNGMGFLMIRDASGLGATAGFGASAGNPAQSAANLAAFLAQHGYNRSVTAGLSAAAISAVYFGQKISASGAMGLSTILYYPDYGTIKQGLSSKAIWYFYNRLITAPHQVVMDLRPSLSAPNSLYIENHAGAGSVFDANFRPRFEQADSVRAFYDDHNMHACWAWLQRHGLLKGRIKQFLDNALG